MNPTITTIILCLATCIASKAQSNMAVTSTNIVDTIKLTNGSFEARVARGKQKLNLKGWKDFGKILFPIETPPDIHPANYWGVTTKPVHGNTYLGLAIRDNNTYEAVSQKLPSPLIAGQYYTFSLTLCRSSTFTSRSRMTRKTEKYEFPAVCNIKGLVGDSIFLLASSPPIVNTKWVRFTFTLHPKVDISEIILEAGFVDTKNNAYNGHLLMDAASDLVRLEKSE